jgi:uncharacterized membrane protein YgcG
LLHIESVIHNKPDCLFRGTWSSINATISGLKTSTRLVTRLGTHYLLLVLSAMLFALCAMPLSVANAKTATLAWDSNDEPDLEGYVVYRNTNSPGPPYKYSDTVPEDELADPLHPQAKLTGLQEGSEYYIALTAYNTEGVESNFSEEVCVEVINDTVKLCSESASQPTSMSSTGTTSTSGGGDDGGGSGGGSSCFISTASHSPSDKSLLVFILFTISAIGIGTYGYKKRVLNSAID